MSILIVIAGPTASGKTSLAISLAIKLNAEIINADSRQFYKGMDIGTAKPTKEDLAKIKHHFIDIKSPEELYSAGDFEADVIAFLKEYFKFREIAILVGGSGLYIKAVTKGFDDLPSVPKTLRDKWKTTLKTGGIKALQSALNLADPEYFAEVDANNPQRLQRALEVIESSGEKFSQLRRANQKKREFEMVQFALSPDRNILYNRINERVDQMMNSGLLEEVKSFLLQRQQNALQTVGYSELFDFMDGKCTQDEAVAKIKQHTRNYAKRQYTWFRKQREMIILTDYNLEILMKHLSELDYV